MCNKEPASKHRPDQIIAGLANCASSAQLVHFQLCETRLAYALQVEHVDEDYASAVATT